MQELLMSTIVFDILQYPQPFTSNNIEPRVLGTATLPLCDWCCVASANQQQSWLLPLTLGV
jgi:hypothetical protein